MKGGGPQRELNPPGNWFAPPGSNRSSGGGNEAAEAFGVDPNDVYHVLRTILEELPSGAAKLEREHKWGRSQLTPSRKGAAGLYGVGHVEDCEIGIVELTHSHFSDWDEALDSAVLSFADRSNLTYGATVVA